MGGGSFRFKQFTVRQEASAMKVGTDGVLLGAWFGATGAERRVLDVGTGTGLLALMAAQRLPWAERIDAVEIEGAAASEAARNAADSPWGDRVVVHCVDFNEYSRGEGLEKYDLVVSNPPYFNGSYKSPEAERTAARHAELLTSDDLLAGVCRVLEPERGRFAAIFPYENAAVFVAKAASAGLFCNRLTEVYSKPGSGIKRLMGEFSFTKRLLTADRLVISDEGGEYTAEHRALTKDFYLKH